MKPKCDDFVRAAMTPIGGRYSDAKIGTTMKEAQDWRFKELLTYGEWKLPDSRQIGYMGERLYLENGSHCPAERGIISFMGLRTDPAFKTILNFCF